MTSTEKRQAWRKANFLCKCLDNATVTNCGIRSFCNLCSYIISCMNLMQSTKCPGCNTFESWEHIGFLCLACQFANMTSQNPFRKRYEILLNAWLPLPTDIMSSTETSDQESIDKARYNTEMCTTPCFEHSTLLRLRRQSIDDSLSTIRLWSSPEQNHVIFEDLIELKKNLMKSTSMDDPKQKSQASQNSSL